MCEIRAYEREVTELGETGEGSTMKKQTGRKEEQTWKKKKGVERERERIILLFS